MGDDFGKLPEHSAWGTPPPTDEAHRTRPSDTLLPDAQPLAGPGEEPGTQPFVHHSPAPAGKTILLTILLAMLGFAVCAALIHACIRNPLYLHADIRSGKLQIMRDWTGRAYSASFGSSHIHNGFDPRAFDQALAGSTLATRSINLGVAGGSQTEQRAMALEFVRHLQPPPASSPQNCLVLLELNAGANFAPNHLVHPRAIDIYDLQNTRFVGSLISPQMSFTQRMGRTIVADIVMAFHYSNVGMLSNALFPSSEPDSTYADETALDRRGILNMEPSVGTVKALTKVIAEAPQQPARVPGEIYPGTYSLIEELQHASALRGVQFVYVVFPRVWDLHREEIYPESLHVNGMEVPIVNLGRPDLYPQIYKTANWFDDSHLDTQGAVMVSTLIANQLKAFYASHPISSRCGG